MVQFSTCRCFPARNLIPLIPLHAPLMDMPRIITLSVAPALTMMPLTLAASMPASVPSPSIVMDLVIVTAPKPPGSKTEISPQAAVFEIAPAKVLHGAVRLHGFTSSPTPETQVLVACACAAEATANMKHAMINPLITILCFAIPALLLKVKVLGHEF